MKASPHSEQRFQDSFSALLEQVGQAEKHREVSIEKRKGFEMENLRRYTENEFDLRCGETQQCAGRMFKGNADLFKSIDGRHRLISGNGVEISGVEIADFRSSFVGQCPAVTDAENGGEKLLGEHGAPALSVNIIASMNDILLVFLQRESLFSRHRFNLFADTKVITDFTYTNRTLRMRERLTDFRSDVFVFEGDGHIISLSFYRLRQRDVPCLWLVVTNQGANIQ